MKKLVCAFAVMVLLTSSVLAAQRVNGYTTRNGTYVAPHYRSNSDGLKYNNYSTRGNYNPYTGSKGYKSSDYRVPTNTYKPRYSKIKNWWLNETRL